MRIALPKGRLLENVLALLARASLAFAFTSDRDYRPRCADPAISAKVVKVRAVPQLVALGRFQVGFAGLDLVQDAAYEAVVPVLDLGLNPVRLVAAVPAGCEAFLEHPPKRPIVIATEYLRLADDWALSHNLAHVTVETWGSTEGYAPEDADVVFDCVETGCTLAANGMVVIEELMASTTWVVANRDALSDAVFRPRIEALIERLQGAVA